MIDDDPHMHRIVRLFLNNQPFELDGVTTARVALHKLNEQKYDLILSDIQMPGMDGVELIKTIKEKFPSLPVIVLSAYEVDLFQKKLGRFEKVRIIPKPFDQNTLITTIEELWTGNRF